MKHPLSDLEPTEIWEHFYQLTQIPHPSGGEAAICKHVYRLAADLGLDVAMDRAGGDDCGNILVRLPPTPGCEKAPITVFQSHLDMVALPAENRERPLALIRDGSLLRARGSTLGADNGIAVAMALALMTRRDIVHGPMELLFTVNEEAGMTGVIALSDRWLKGSFLINADTLDEGILTVCCAGVNRSLFRLPFHREPVTKEWSALCVGVGGGKGGHSSLMDRGRANAGQQLVRMLLAAAQAMPLRLHEIAWGSVDNAIPAEAHAVVLVRQDRQGDLKDALPAWDAVFKKEFGRHDGALRTLPAAPATLPESAPGIAMTLTVLSFLLALPHGVFTMSPDMEGLVDTSANLAVVQTSPTALTVRVSQRGMTDTSLDAVIARCEAVGHLAGADVTQVGKTYGWKPDLASPLLALCRDAYRQVFGGEPKVAGTHGMLECGLIKAKYPHIDMIALGTEIFDAHAPTKPDFVAGVDSDSTGERIDVTDMPRYWEFIKKVLGKLAEASG